MIRPIIHRQLTRGDLACLVDEIARMDVSEGREADEALQAGAVDTVLDSPAALEAVLGRGGAPAPLPLTLLWYIPIRAQLRTRGVTDILLADYAATLPVVFATSHSQRAIAQGENGMTEWWRYVAALPQGTVAQAEAAADAAALALWSAAAKAVAWCARTSRSPAACSRSPPICSRSPPPKRRRCATAPPKHGPSCMPHSSRHASITSAKIRTAAKAASTGS